MLRNALGRGLGALIREPEPQATIEPTPSHAEPVSAGAAAAAPAREPAAGGPFQIDIDLIDPSPYQPRTRFREEALDELSRSIQSSGIVQPLVVRRVAGRFQLIAGERRWRAAQRASMHTVPVVLRDIPEELALEMTLVENLQREDLNPVEQAHAFQRLIDEFHLTQEQVAERTGKDRTTIANSVRLLKLESPIQELLEEGRITAGHARALLAVADSQARLTIARKVARGGMTVRQVERLATRSSKPHASAPIFTVDANTKAALEELQREYGTRVHMHPRQGSKPGQLVFEYYDDSDLARLYDQLMRK